MLPTRPSLSMARSIVLAGVTLMCSLSAWSQASAPIAGSAEQGRVLQTTQLNPQPVAQTVCRWVPSGAHQVQSCSSEMSAAAPAFEVVYEYRGQIYSVILPHDPGAFVTVQAPAAPLQTITSHPSTVTHVHETVIHRPAPVVVGGWGVQVRPWVVWPSVALHWGYGRPHGHRHWHGGRHGHHRRHP